MSIYKDYYEQHHKPRKPRIKYQKFLVRDACSYNTVYFIIKLEMKEYWHQAKAYMLDMRQNHNNDNFSDRELIEQFFIKNNIPYQIIDLPDEELFL